MSCLNVRTDFTISVGDCEPHQRAHDAQPIVSRGWGGSSLVQNCDNVFTLQRNARVGVLIANPLNDVATRCFG
jgi:hypothetical protein